MHICPENLEACLDGELSPDETRRIRAHMADCPACRKRKAAYDAVSRWMAEVPPVSAPPGLREKTLGRLTGTPYSRESRMRWQDMGWAAMLAGVIIGGIMAHMAMTQTRSSGYPAESGIAAVSYAELVVDSGEIL